MAASNNGLDPDLWRHYWLRPAHQQMLAQSMPAQMDGGWVPLIGVNDFVTAQAANTDERRLDYYGRRDSVWSLVQRVKGSKKSSLVCRLCNLVGCRCASNATDYDVKALANELGDPIGTVYTELGIIDRARPLVGLWNPVPVAEAQRRGIPLTHLYGVHNRYSIPALYSQIYPYLTTTEYRPRLPANYVHPLRSSL